MYTKCLVVLALVAFSAATLVLHKNILVKQIGDTVLLSDGQDKTVKLHLDRFDVVKGLKTIDILLESNGIVKKFTILDDNVTLGKRQSDLLKEIFLQFNGILDKETFEVLMTVVEKHVQIGELNNFVLDTLKFVYSHDVNDILNIELIFKKDQILFQDKITKDMLYQNRLEKITPYNRYDMLINGNKLNYLDMDRTNYFDKMDFDKMDYYKNMMQNKLYNKYNLDKEIELRTILGTMDDIEKEDLIKKILLKDLEKEMYFQDKTYDIPTVYRVGQNFQTDKILYPELQGMNKMLIGQRVFGDNKYGLTMNNNQEIRDLTWRKVFGFPENRRNQLIKDQRFGDVIGKQMLYDDVLLNKDLTFNRLTTQQPLFWGKIGQTGRQQFLRDDVRRFDRVTPLIYGQDVMETRVPVMRKIQYLEPREDRFNIVY